MSGETPAERKLREELEAEVKRLEAQRKREEEEERRKLLGN